jgi:hypothetical protein
MVETARAPITTILFTDLVDSTTLMQRVGDERAQKLFETHHQLRWEHVDLERRSLRLCGLEVWLEGRGPQRASRVISRQARKS